MRLFVAVDPPDEIKTAIEDVAAGLRDRIPGARWTRSEGRHLTLAFLGSVGDDRTEAIGDALADAVTGCVPFGVRLATSVGAFPHLRRPRVVWVGVEEGAEDLTDLQRRIVDALRPLGFDPEERAYHPHLTLARIPRPAPVSGLDAVTVPPLAFEPQDVVLFRSQPQRGGARYTGLLRVPLG